MGSEERVCSVCHVRKPIEDITQHTHSGIRPICKGCIDSNEATKVQLVELLNRHCSPAMYDRYDLWPEGIAHHRDRDGRWVCIGFVPIDNAIGELKKMMANYRYMAQEIEDGLSAIKR